MIRRELDFHPRSAPGWQSRDKILDKLIWILDVRRDSLLCFLLFDCLLGYRTIGTTTTKLNALDDVICINVLDAAAAKLAILTHR